MAKEPVRVKGTTSYIHVRAELVRAAQYRGVTTHQDIAVIMGLPTKGSYMGSAVGRILGEIVEDEVAARRPMLSAVAVGVSGKPGPGFGTLARQLGRVPKGVSDETYWESQKQAAYAAWRRPLPK